MTDIVERLDAAGCTAGCNSAKVCLCALCQDAAAEIAALRARVEELEAGLREIAEERFGLGTLGTDYEQMKVWHAHWSRCAERARRALGDDHGR